MDEKRAIELANEIKTTPENIVREEYETIFLKEILESEYGKNFVFKGGTALRLAYNSMRFSEDLDFSLIGKISWQNVKKTLKKRAVDFETIKIKDLREKYYTYFALFSIKETFLHQPFLLRIEISKRLVDWKKGKDFDLLQLTTPVCALATAGFVINLERAYKDKKGAVRERVKGRDLFDLWWLGQKLNKKEKFLANKRFDKKIIEAELKKFLPKGNWWVIGELFPKR